ncbi:MAG: hypothetical protein IKK69_04390 [Firmicutes bacterium]|nr:hypothetical protein [Bacillota bacterium]
MNCSSNNNQGRTENLVFLNKVFYDNTGSSCPVIYPLTTTSEAFTQQLVISSSNSGNCGCGSGCNCSNNCDFDLCNAQFTVTNSCVTVTSAALSEAAEFTAEDVTVDGFPVTSLTLENGRYFADLNGIMTQLTRCPGTPVDRHICGNCNSCDDCNPQCDNDGHFFLAEVGGPWEMYLNITIDGYVSNGRCSRDFRLCMRTRTDAAGNFPVTVDASNNFALQCVNIPCQSQGIAPSLRFNFEACGMLLNPVLTIDPTTEQPGNGCPAPASLILTASLVITPKINLQVVRPSLFAINASEVTTCCDDLGQCDDCAPSSECGSQPIAVDSFSCQYCGDTNGFRF